MAKMRVWKVAAAAAVVVAVASLGMAAGAERAQQHGGPESRAGAVSPTESVFVPIVPCRIVNTQNGQPLAVGELRGFSMAGDTRPQGGAAACGIPTYATALELNVTAVRSEDNGYLRLGPTDAGLPNATFLNYTRSVNLSNAGTVAVESGTGPNLMVKAFVERTHVVIDVLGYYAASLHATVGSNGEVLNSSGLLSATRNAVGSYTLVFDRDVRLCGVTGVSTILPFTNGGEVVATANGGAAVQVNTAGASGALVDSYFSVTVVC